MVHIELLKIFIPGKQKRFKNNQQIMEEKQPVSEIIKFVEKDFLISENISLIPSANLFSLEEFKKYLTEKLKFLLDEKFDILVNILYRIDISEKKLSQLFSGKNRDSIPATLADLIIERQLQKIRLRKLYNEGKL
jgi:hypothetical protein